MRFERYDRIAEPYSVMWPLLVPGYAPILGAMLDVVLARANRPREILDLGCGPGSATVAVAPGCDPRVSATLVDGSAAMLQAAAAAVRTCARVRAVVHGDFTETPTAQRAFVPSRYDLVLCSFALHHLADPDKRAVLERAAAALAPGGLLLLADEVATDKPGGWDVVERVRARFIESQRAAGRIDPAVWGIETSLPAELRLPFLPTRIEDLTSWMARAGLAVSCPVSLFGAALLIGMKLG